MTELKNPPDGFLQLQCGNLMLTLPYRYADIPRIKRALWMLQRGNFNIWDTMTPVERAEAEADVDWLLAKFDRKKLTKP